MFRTVFGRAVRRFSTEATSKPAAAELPIVLHGLNARYANALYLAASKAGELNKVVADLKTVQQWPENPTFMNYIHSPVVTKQDTVADMTKLCKGMSKSTTGFVSLVAENGRLQDLKGILDKFAELVRAKEGIVKASATVPFELNPEQLKALKSSIISGYLQKGQSLDLSLKVDPSLLGGVQVNIGDQYIDLSVLSEVKRVTRVLS